MKKCLRILWKTLLTVLIIVAVLLVFILCGGLGPLVKWTAPTIAKCMGAEVKLEKCVILPLGGYVCIEGLQVENPESFRTQNAKVYAESPLAKVGKLELDFGMRSLFGSEYIVDKIELSGVRALYAFDYKTTNVDALMAQMGLAGGAQTSEDVAAVPVETPAPEAEPVAAKPAAPAPEAEPVAAKPAAPAKMKDVRLAYVHLEDNSVTLRKFVNLPVVLPPMTLEDTNSQELRQKLQSAIEPVMKALNGVGDTLGAATEQLGDGVTKTTEVLGEKLGKTSETLGSGLDVTSETLGESAKAIGESAKAIGEGAKESLKNMKDLFKKK